MDSKILQGRKGIASHLKITEKMVDKMVLDGLPVNRISGRLFAHIDDIDRYFKYDSKPTNQAQYFQRLIYLSEQILDRIDVIIKNGCQEK